MPRLFLAFFFLLSLVAESPAQDLTPGSSGVPLQSLPATLTWLGNSFPGDGINQGVGNFFPLTLNDLAVAKDGTVMTATGFNEAFPRFHSKRAVSSIRSVAV